MPIDVTCSCGRKARVKDEFAGKKVKCPTCGNGLTIPQASEPDAEESAFALLQETDAESSKTKPELAQERKPREERPEPASPSADPPTKPKLPKPKKRKKIDYETKEEHFSGPPRIVLSPGVLAALGMILFGGIIIGIGVSSGRIPIYGFILIGLGIIRLARGLLGMEEE